jgi:hypothetical protein
MNPQVRAFRNAVSEACHGDGRSSKAFFHDGLEDILEQAQAHNWDSQEIAAQVLAQCCVEDGRFSTRYVIRLHSVMLYLNGQHGRLQSEEQAWRDLVAILNEGGHIGSIRSWMQTRY